MKQKIVSVIALTSARINPSRSAKRQKKPLFSGGRAETKRQAVQSLFVGLIVFCSFLPSLLRAKETDVVVRTSPHDIILFMGPQTATPVGEGNVLPPDATDIEKMLRFRLKEELNPLFSGVYVTYYGFVGTLDENGELLLPRKNPEDDLTLIVTKGMRPIVIQGNTVEQIKRKKKSPAAYYSLKRTASPEGLCFWEVTKLPLPENRIIPPQAIVIYARPEDIFVPEGIFTAICGPHLLLPPIYPTKRINRDLNALSFMKISKYFAPVRKTYKYLKDRYTFMLS